MKLNIAPNVREMGKRAATEGAKHIRAAIAEKGHANIIVATGASQFEVLAALVEEDIDWSVVTGFHLDEYIGLSSDHPASFVGYLQERFVSKIPIKAFHFIDGTLLPEETIARVGALLKDHPTDVTFCGIGENGHLAFNDPPADFETQEPYIIVDLDEACRKQQHGEGWFPTLEDVPKKAVSMSIQQILKSKTICCSVPDGRKAEAVRNSVEGPITPTVPASILQNHEGTTLFIDEPAAALLSDATRLKSEGV